MLHIKRGEVSVLVTKFLAEKQRVKGSSAGISRSSDTSSLAKVSDFRIMRYSCNFFPKCNSGVSVLLGSMKEEGYGLLPKLC